MRTSILPIATLAITALLTPCQAGDDFSALLADLSFGDAPALSEALSVSSSQPAEALRPAPSGITMPKIVMPKQRQATPVVVALQTPQTTSKPVVDDKIEFDTAFIVQERQVQAKPAGHICESCNTNTCDQQASCDTCNVCTPHIKPRLPSSSFYQYFRSNRCHTDVWDGYRQKCCYSNQVLHGRATHIDKACEKLNGLCSQCNECGDIIDPCADGSCGCGSSCGSCSTSVDCAAPAKCDTRCDNGCAVGCDG